ncbi:MULTISPECIES: YfmQ family protein [unclassified Cytobacillus]|uniref:YfmQ family protein n=1 Tax=unclassified Cytobacillus TaxID=2675268 RepID=UPI00203AF407|nr:YfmQ family protein [Cytobacillus sp. AMY 15.2]MCM3092612.1 YfmQ family protein [Cytobacillus sp. AMY 15.2]
MTWAVLIPIILVSLLKIVITCLPTGTVNWLLSKFETHSKLKEEDVTVTFGDKILEGKEKIKFIDQFNEGIFIKKHYIHPGNEQNFLSPPKAGTPVIMDVKRGETNLRIIVYSYSDRIDVVKQYRKKVVAYSLISEELQHSRLAV